ncbi:hypothetical protein B0H10DRAFT_2187753 [Mycena sp. CBHHK59/15]|nr:hypothetical protein B0H10DRAFT_2187753 [Mycena sp. CBHHK59/15]
MFEGIQQGLKDSQNLPTQIIYGGGHHFVTSLRPNLEIVTSASARHILFTCFRGGNRAGNPAMPRVDRCDRLSPTAEKSELVGAAPGQGKGVSAHFRALGMTDFSTSGETVGAAHRGQAFATGESAPSDRKHRRVPDITYPRRNKREGARDAGRASHRRCRWWSVISRSNPLGVRNGPKIWAPDRNAYKSGEKDCARKRPKRGNWIGPLSALA